LGGPRRVQRLAGVLAWLAILVACGKATTRLSAGRTEAAGLPLWDEAAQGFAGLRVADAIRHWDVVGLLRALNEQVVWPPVHSLLLAPCFLAFGHGFEIPSMLSRCAFVVTPLVLLACGLALDPKRGAAIGLLASALLLCSPDFRVFASLGMLEMPGALLLLIALWLALRFANARERADSASPERRGLATALGGATAALFLFKYNYGLIWIGALALDAVLRRTPEQRGALFESAARAWRSGALRRPMPVIVTLWVLALVAIRVSGGGVFEPFGQRISMRSPGNGAYALLVVLVVWAIVAWRRNPEGWRARWRSWPGTRRAFLVAAFVPILLWLLVPSPNRVRALVDFVQNRSSGPSPLSLEGLMFYPRAFVEQFSPSPWLGGIAFALALIPPIGRGEGRSARRLAWVAMLTGIAATVAHGYHDPRFFFTTAPLVWLNASRAATELVGLAAARRARALAGVAWAALFAAGVALPWIAPPNERAVAARLALYRGDRSILPALDRVLERASSESAPSVLLGYSIGLSPGLISWRARQLSDAIDLEALPRRAPWLERGASDEAIDARIERLSGPGRLFLVALATPASPVWGHAYSDETWADSVTLERLRRMPEATVEWDSLGASGFRFAAVRVKLPR
jgi:hypothetical protein